MRVRTWQFKMETKIISSTTKTMMNNLHLAVSWVLLSCLLEPPLARACSHCPPKHPQHCFFPMPLYWVKRYWRSDRTQILSEARNMYGPKQKGYFWDSTRMAGYGLLQPRKFPSVFDEMPGRMNTVKWLIPNDSPLLSYHRLQHAQLFHPCDTKDIWMPLRDPFASSQCRKEEHAFGKEYFFHFFLSGDATVSLHRDAGSKRFMLRSSAKSQRSTSSVTRLEAE